MPSLKKSAFKGIRILITSGPTSVPIDDMRVITNRSTGEMGRLIAAYLSNAGASVTLLEGAVTTTALLSKKVNVRKFYFYKELALFLKEELSKKYSIIIHAAAVSDFSLKKTFRRKIDSKKQVNLELQPTRKLINLIKKFAPKSFLVGFKFESKINVQSPFDQIRSLFSDAACDLVVLNENNSIGYKALLVSANRKISSIMDSKKKLIQELSRSLGI